ncbi:MAG: hypothetical protein ACLQVG_04140 [Terriglobia bacterium]
MLIDSEKKMIEIQFQKLAEAVSERQKIEETIGRHEAAVRGLLALVEDEKELIGYLEKLEDTIRPVGFTNAVRDVLQRTTEKLSATEVKDGLSKIGFNVDGYSNPLASIHTVLKRLLVAGEVETGTRDGKTTYSWKGIRRFPRTSSREAKRRAFIGQSLGASRSLSRTSNEMIKAQIEAAKRKV